MKYLMAPLEELANISCLLQLQCSMLQASSLPTRAHSGEWWHGHVSAQHSHNCYDRAAGPQPPRGLRCTESPRSTSGSYAGTRGTAPTRLVLPAGRSLLPGPAGRPGGRGERRARPTVTGEGGSGARVRSYPAAATSASAAPVGRRPGSAAAEPPAPPRRPLVLVPLSAMAAAAAEPSSGRYQQLQNEEEPGETAPVVNDAPPPYSSISAESTAYFDYKDESGFPKPPSYNVATTLPSYDEAERTKAEATIPLVPGRDDDFVTRDDFDDTDQLRIGNDGIFMLTFFMAFLFNWIGFFLSFCLTTSAAGRYGAISGFGLSLIKWILIVRFSTYFPGYFDGQYWLWWVFLVLGFLLFLRGFINYAKVRKMPDTFSTLSRTRVLFIY
ncbi:NEDD4 family-interacting protein 1 [Colius striatus]|uniref:NEDD4 family-interacting protein 1 n=2 Tax=Coraciimorphae TaxID=3073810 RepID=UPI002B1E5704|nr:NEDD4 family-interacting protein 1 [Colius striatus]